MTRSNRLWSNRLWYLFCGLALGVLLALGVDAVRSQEGGSPTAEQATIGSGFTYQGYLQLDSEPVEDTCDFRFDLWDAASGGNQVGGVDTADDVAVTEGRFTVSLNEANEFGDDAFDGGARWLRVRVRCPAGSGSFTTLSPRQPLAPAPYAQSLRPGATISGTVSTGTGALNLRSDQYGLHIPYAGVHGIVVDRAENSGLTIDQAASDGIRVHWAGSPTGSVRHSENNGIEVGGTEGKGLFVGAAGTDGIYVQIADNDGIVVDSAGNPSTTVLSTYRNGLEVRGASGFGAYVGHTDLDGMYVDEVSFDGFQVQNAGDNGIEINGATDFAGYFAGNVYMTGSCTGCTVATFGVNSGETTLMPGDVVTVQGAHTEAMLAETTPVLMEVDRAQSGETPVGVVAGRAELDRGDPADDSATPHLVPREGPAKPGAYVVIITHGPAQVKTGSAAVLSAGTRLTAAGDGATRPLATTTVDGIQVAESAPTVGIVLDEAPTAEGRHWVLVSPQ